MAETEIPLNDIKEWLEQEAAPIVEPLKTEGTSLINNVKERVDDVRENCERLMRNSEIEMSKDSRKTYRRAKILNKLAKYALETIENIEFPDLISSESLQLACDDLEKALAVIGRERAKWFPRISPFFIVDRRRFDVAFGRTVKTLEKLRSFSSHRYTEAKIVEDSFLMVDKLSQSLKKLDAVEKQRKKMELRRSILEKKIDEDQRKTMLIQSRDEVSKLVQTNEEIEELREKVRHSFRHLQKPFLKFQTLALGPGYPLPPDETKKLDEYLTRPFEAFATEDEEYPLLKKLLRKMDDAMTKGKLKLKSTRLKKAQMQINSILHKDALTSMHRSCREAFNGKQRLSTSKAVKTFRKETAQLQKGLEESRKQKELVDSRIAAVDSEYKRALEKIESQKKKLETTVFELTGKEVHVT
ncbi:MAG: hypothetical protein JSV15_02615 [Candidatus Bathyarchaeota archaeon]|nr:MAG: hypothetical protein JSV15_02615 [Candidatus Bathyarchaeota archaeon]